MVQSGHTRFLISQACCAGQESRSYPRLKCSRDHKDGHIDTVFNICLEVEDVDKVCFRMKEHGSKVIYQPTTMDGMDGKVRYAVVTSPCENVIHSLINTHQFQGVFLPGFESSCENPSFSPDGDLVGPGWGTTFMDHIAVVVRPGESRAILDWYRNCCGMRRFLVNKEDHPQEGTVIRDSVGLRLTSGEFMSEWLCKEEGVSWTSDENKVNSHLEDVRNFKLVLAEPLPEPQDSHVHNFIKNHNGGGLQHIGLCSNNIVSTVREMTKSGAQFRNPPPTYYTLPGKMKEISEIENDPDTFKSLGILIDKEANCAEDVKEACDDTEVSEKSDAVEESYLLQTFTKPLFEKETFFLEVIQRRGARGFGTGNILALAQSIMAMYSNHVTEE